MTSLVTSTMHEDTRAVHVLYHTYYPVSQKVDSFIFTITLANKVLLQAFSAVYL